MRKNIKKTIIAVILLLTVVSFIIESYAVSPSKVGNDAKEKKIDKQILGDVLIHVIPTGNDNGSGSAEQPFASLNRARQAVRAAKLSPGLGAIQVILHGGIYFSKSTFVLGPDDSGTKSRPVIYAAQSGETPLVSAGRSISGWCKLDQLPDGVPSVATGQLWVANLPAMPNGGDWTFRALFDREGMLERSRSKITMSAEDFAKLPSGSIETAQSGMPWTWQIDVVTSIDAMKEKVVENIPEGLTKPGTWWLDTKGKRIILWPRTSSEPSAIIAPARIEAIRLEGTPSNPVRFVQFRGLTFSHGDRAIKTPETVVLIPGHDWDFYDQDNAVLRLRNTADIRIEDCTFANSGGSGVRMDHAAKQNTILHNEFRDLGSHGISLIGNLPGQGDVHGGHDVGYNSIHHVGCIYRCASAILSYQSNNTHIHDNFIHDMPYSGIVLFGNRAVIKETSNQPISEKLYGGDNLIEHNEITRLMQQLGDGTGIYISATPPGNIVRRNLIHDVIHQINGGVRTDDLQSDVLVEENLIYELRNGFGIILKHVNHCKNNIVVNCGTLISVRHRGPNLGSTIHGNILVHDGIRGTDNKYGQNGNTPYQPFFSESTPVKLKDYDIVGNILFSTNGTELAERSLYSVSALGKNPGRVVDPHFVDPEKGDFHLQKDSPALAAGFPVIDVWGPRGSVGTQTSKQASRKK